MSELYQYKWIVILLVLAVVFFFIGQYVMTEFMAFAGAFLSTASLVALWQFADDKILGKIDTYKEIIQEKNVALAIYYVAIALVLAVSWGSAFLVFMAGNSYIVNYLK